MGQVSRENRARRFINEFGADYVASLGLAPGQTWTYLGSHLACKDAQDSEVVLVHRLKTPGAANEVLVEAGEVLYDPENWNAEDLADGEVQTQLRLSAATLAERLKKADLVG